MSDSANNTTFQQRSGSAPAVVLVLLAVAVPWGVMTLLGVSQFESWPAAAVPFGLNRVLVAHVLATAPLAMWIGWRLPPSCAGRSPIAICVIAGPVLAALTWIFGDQIGRWMITESSAPGHVLRPVWILALQLPWCVAAALWLKRDTGRTTPFWADGLTALLLATVVPAVYTVNVIQRQEKLVADALLTQQFRKALGIVGRLEMLKSSQEILEQPPNQLRSELEQQVQFLVESVQQPLSANPTRDEILTRAFYLAGLGEYEAMRRVLGNLPLTDAQASYRLAKGYEAQGQWNEAVGQYRTTIRLATTSDDPHLQRATIRGAYERLANNLRRAGRHADAERELSDAIEEMPEHRDLFLFQLGIHYQLAGRTADAIKHFELATEANPDWADEVSAELTSLNQQPQGCLLRATQAATR